MLNRNKKALILICLVIISLNLISKEVPKARSVDPFFTLVAKCFTPTQMDIMLLIKEQIARVGINLDVIDVLMPDNDATKIRNYDLTIMEFNNQTVVDFKQYQIDDPFFADFYSENGSINVSGYDTGIDWVEELGTGKNELYIKNGLQLTPNDSQERINLCWEWQHYMMDKILPCLPLFIHKDDNSSLQLLVFNMREVRPIIGNRAPAPGNINYKIGLAIRKIIAYAINREEIRRVVLGDEYRIVDHPISPIFSDWLNPNIIRYCHDIYVARRYFDIAGYSLCDFYPGNYEDPFPNFTDWEAVCSRNDPVNPTIDVTGFTLIITCLGLGTITIISFVFWKKRRKNRC
ncbi:MAG: hypothetical protein GPJ52_12860 [Candidatus Heimdallarchaeota archaeon]|nr:hypothetical protein [Candidatus Heimdallarchaeota archaeon]